MIMISRPLVTIFSKHGNGVSLSYLRVISSHVHFKTFSVYSKGLICFPATSNFDCNIVDPLIALNSSNFLELQQHTKNASPTADTTILKDKVPHSKLVGLAARFGVPLKVKNKDEERDSSIYKHLYRDRDLTAHQLGFVHPHLGSFTDDESVDLRSNSFGDIHYCSAVNENNKTDSTGGGRPSEQKLSNVYEILTDSIRNIFVAPMNYRVYNKDVVLEDNLRNARFEGIYPYVKEASKLRIYGHARFVHVQMDILKATMHPEEGLIKIRWRVVGLTLTKAIINFVKLHLYSAVGRKDSGRIYYDGFSTFHIGADGLVFKHVIDNMISDSQHEEKKSVSKVSSFLGITTKTAPAESAFTSIENTDSPVKEAKIER